MIPEQRPTPIGDFIQEDILNEFHLSQGQLALALKVSRRTINELVNNKRNLTADMAVRLAKFTKTSPQTWLNLQMSLDLWDALHHKKRAKDFQSIQAYAA
jgi:antitoxin HigA-1